jgi:hypothetical protein
MVESGGANAKRQFLSKDGQRCYRRARRNKSCHDRLPTGKSCRDAPEKNLPDLPLAFILSVWIFAAAFRVGS